MQNRRGRPLPRLTSIAAISLCCLLAIAGRAQAQSAEAEALFDDGNSLMKQGKYAEACDAFEGSNKLEPRAGTLIRLGECRERNSQLASAWSAYRDALTRVKDEKKKKIATAKVAELEPKLSRLTISVPEKTKVTGLEITRNGVVVDPVLWNRAIPMNGGRYVIVARALDHGEWTQTVDVPTQSEKVTVEVPRLDTVRKPSKAEPKPVTPVESGNGEDVAPAKTNDDANTHGGASRHATDVDETDDDTVEPAPSSFTGKRKLGVVLTVVAIGAGVGGVVLGKSAKAHERDAFALCPDPTFPCAGGVDANALLDKGRTQALMANIAFGVAGASLVTAVVLFVTGGPDRSGRDVAIVPTIGAHRTGLALGGHF